MDRYLYGKKGFLTSQTRTAKHPMNYCSSNTYLTALGALHLGVWASLTLALGNQVNYTIYQHWVGYKAVVFCQFQQKFAGAPNIVGVHIVVYLNFIWRLKRGLSTSTTLQHFNTSTHLTINSMKNTAEHGIEKKNPQTMKRNFVLYTIFSQAYENLFSNVHCVQL